MKADQDARERGAAHLVTGPVGESLAWSEALPDMIGRDAAAIPRTADAWLELLHPEDREHFQRTSIEARKAGVGVELEYRLKNAAGDWVRIRHLMEPLTSGQHANAARHWLCTLQEPTATTQTVRSVKASEELYGATFEEAVMGVGSAITDLKPAGEALRQSQQLLRLVLATLPVGVSLIDLTGDIVLANSAAQRIWHGMIVPGSERWAQSKGFWHDSGKRIAPDEWASARALRSGQTTLNELIDIEAYDGKQKTIESSTVPISNAEGLIVGAVVVHEDATERVRAQGALQELAHRLQQLSRSLLTVQEEERRHLSRELHDEFGQLLAAITLHLHAAKAVAGDAAQPSLDESMALVQRAGAQMRSLALELRPTMLETGGLGATLRWLAEQHQQRTGTITEVVGHLGDLPSNLAIACFRVVQEALTNAVRHARAQHVWIELEQSDALLELVVRDDGVGFDVTRTLDRSARGPNLGLLGMRERMEILGGRLEIDSQAGRGTRIHVSLPLTESITAPTQQST
jgi:signal transduction histidine kinase